MSEVNPARMSRVLDNVRDLAVERETFETVVGVVVRLHSSWSVIEAARDSAVAIAAEGPCDEIASRVAAWLTLLSQLGLFRGDASR